MNVGGFEDHSDYSSYISKCGLTACLQFLSTDGTKDEPCT